MAERFIQNANYLGITSHTGKLLAHIDLNTGETIQNDGILVSVNFGEQPTFLKKDGEIYLLSALENKTDS